MSGKKILAGVFAAAVLLKLLFIMFMPGKWMHFVGLFWGHTAVVWWVYLALIIISGYYVFSSLDLIDIALVMLFTSLVFGIGLIPYSAPLAKLGGAIAAAGLGKMWLALAIWGVLAVAVLHRLFASQRKR